MVIHLTAAAVGSLAPTDAYPFPPKHLAPDIRARIEARRWSIDRQRSLAAYSRLLRTVERVRGPIPASTVVCSTDGGKPMFTPHQGIEFNLSHAGRLAVCALAACPVGVDVEEISAARDHAPSQFFAPEERAWLHSVPDHRRTVSFFLLWSAKESYLKALGSGLLRPLDSFAVLFDTAAPGCCCRPAAGPWTRPLVVDPERADPPAALFVRDDWIPGCAVSVCALPPEGFVRGVTVERRLLGGVGGGGEDAV